MIHDPVARRGADEDGLADFAEDPRAEAETPAVATPVRWSFWLGVTVVLVVTMVLAVIIHTRSPIPSRTALPASTAPALAPVVTLPPILSPSIPAPRAARPSSATVSRPAPAVEVPSVDTRVFSVPNADALVVPSAPAMPVSPADTESSVSAEPPAPVALRAQEELAIRALLDAYRDAYENLDAVSTARLWPGVDTAALARAFSTLSRQQVEFDSCSVDVGDEGPAAASAQSASAPRKAGHYVRATAHCRGWLRYVRRVGSPTPQSRNLTWTFQFDRRSGMWLIADVAAQ